MGQEDRLKKEIDMLGKVLAGILAKLLGVKDPQSSNISTEAQQELERALELSLDDILEADDEEAVNTLLRKGFKYEHLGPIADIIYQLAEQSLQTQGRSESTGALYTKAHYFYTYLNETGLTYSLDRHFKIERIKALEL